MGVVYGDIMGGVWGYYGWCMGILWYGDIMGGVANVANIRKHNFPSICKL